MNIIKFLGIISLLLIACLSGALVRGDYREAVDGTLRLRVFEPKDLSTHNSPEVEVSGEANSGAVVSINNNILIVPKNKKFKSTVLLQEGLNRLEIIASDASGNEAFLFISIYHEP